MPDLSSLEAAVGPRYVVDEHVSGGSAALAAFGRDRATDEEVFIKVRSFEQHDSVGERTRNEAEMYDSVSHRQIPKLVEADPDAEHPFIVTERMPGKPVNVDRMRAYPDHEQVARISRSMLVALEALHEGSIIHGDATLSNAVVPMSGPVSVVDLELARRIEEPDEGPVVEGIESDDDMVGTIMYMPPERFSELEKATVKGDIYAAGIGAFAMAHGTYPFIGDHTKVILDKLSGHELDWWMHRSRNVPAELRIIINRATQANPAERYGSAGEMIEDFDRFLRG